MADNNMGSYHLPHISKQQHSEASSRAQSEPVEAAAKRGSKKRSK